MPHLRRLSQIWIENAVYFITTRTFVRRPILCEATTASILIEEWAHSRRHHNWLAGRFSIMPDHVHFFASALPSGKALRYFVAGWKEWTAKRLNKTVGIEPPVWQPRFFDHLLRSAESRSEKWNYVRDNPVRAGLVKNAEDWPYQGSIHFE